jgi:hypothetical protein
MNSGVGGAAAFEKACEPAFARLPSSMLPLCLRTLIAHLEATKPRIAGSWWPHNTSHQNTEAQHAFWACPAHAWQAF